ncbi:MAG: flavodoxin family protein, partial [Coriobacteriales bacterium]|nr:flavodoxin family protein [Coriobacteriales bacterium]
MTDEQIKLEDFEEDEKSADEPIAAKAAATVDIAFEPAVEPTTNIVEEPGVEVAPTVTVVLAPIIPEKKPDILFISGSPRRGASVALVKILEQGARQAGALTQHFFLSEKSIKPCVGCGYCEKAGVCILAGKSKDGHFIDDYLELKAVLDRVDAVGIVCPLYFAGPPSQFKALLDRFQPYYSLKYCLNKSQQAKRPAQLYVIGNGGPGESHGYNPLVGVTRSAFNVAGFSLDKVHDFVGYKPPHNV